MALFINEKYIGKLNGYRRNGKSWVFDLAENFTISVKFENIKRFTQLASREYPKGYLEVTTF